MLLSCKVSLSWVAFALTWSGGTQEHGAATFPVRQTRDGVQRGYMGSLTFVFLRLGPITPHGAGQFECKPSGHAGHRAAYDFEAMR